MLRHNHDQLTTFGIGAEHAPGFWRGVIRQLIAKGALDVDTNGHGGLFLQADRARPILRGEARVMLREDAAAPPRPARGGKRRADAVPLSAAEEGPFEALRRWRATEAKAQSVPAYVIFQDATLREIAAVRPATLDQLAQIRGVGTSKLDRYGAEVLAVLARC